MAITFNCGACGKSLTTTDDKAGRKAKCPGCGEVVTVPGSAADEELDADDALETDDADEDDLEDPSSRPARIRDTGTKTCPMCGAENPRRTKTCTACGEKFEEAEDKETGPRQSRIIDPGEVISAAWTIYKNELGLVLGSVVVFILISIAAIIPMYVVVFAAQMQIMQGQDGTVLSLLGNLLQIPYILVMWFMNIGVSKVLYKVARGKQTSIGEIFSGGPYFLRMIGASIIFTIMAFIGGMLCVIPGIIVMLMFWPYVFVLIDENPGGVDCLWRSKEITQGNWGSVFILALVWFALILLGYMALCLGVIFTMPLASLMFAVAYCHMTGQRTAE